VIFGGGIIPEADRQALKDKGVGEIFTPGATTQEIITWLQNAVGANSK
jgi:methylmalonyl-CoA mutase C-terminal domain/subunit